MREFGIALQTLGFPSEQIQQLVGWPEDPALRPTKDNIERAFAELEKKAGKNSKIFVCMSGHGTRVPIPESQLDIRDPKNVELDGFDEAFVAADARYEGDELLNLIRDNELGSWLDRLRAKGAHVWIVFDCCHSGTMSRGVADSESDEQSRELSAMELGVPGEIVQRARSRASNPEYEEASVAVEEGLLDSPNDAPSGGSLVAFYAAQPFETAPDLPCPKGAPKTSENFFGLLSYNTLQVLLQQRPATRLTYRELGYLVTARYRAERGSRGPTPSFSGDLDHEVLEVQEWPGRSTIRLQQHGELWNVNAGELHGLSVGSVLKLSPPSADSTATDVVGFVRVREISAATAVIEPCEYLGAAAISQEQLRESMRCEVVSRNLANRRVHLTVSESDPAVTALTIALRATTDSLAAEMSEFVELIDTHENSDGEWELCALSPAEVQARYQLKIDGPRVLLIKREANTSVSPAKGMPVNSLSRSAGQVYQSYDPKSAEQLRANIKSDLMKIFTWQNLWQLAGKVSANLTDPGTDVAVELVAIDGDSDSRESPLLSNSGFSAGQRLELRVKNCGTDRLWVSLVFLNSNHGINVEQTQQLNRGGEQDSSLQPIRFQLNGKTPGRQGWLVIASSAEANREQPDYSFLAQSPLGKSTKQLPPLNRSMPTDFENLMYTVAGRDGKTRGQTLSVTVSHPVLVIRSWEFKLTPDDLE